MKIALYKITGSGDSLFVREVDIGTAMAYVRVSEIVDVEFPPLPPEVIIPAELAALDAKEAHLREAFNVRLADLNVERANLRALIHESA